MDTVTYSNISPSMHFPCVSWRYLAMVTSPFSSDEDDYERLHVFDVLADWKESLIEPGGEKNDGDYCTADPGLYFDDESSEEESEEN